MNNRFYHNHTTLVARLADRAQEECYERYIERLKTERADTVLFFDMFNQRFAELIIQECMSNLHLNGYDDALNQVKEHFGVEE